MKSLTSRFRLSPRSFASVAFSAVILLVISGCNGAAASSGERVKLVLTPVATPTQTAPAASTVAPVSYTVKSGDTLWDIANLFGVTLDDIVRANNIADPSSLAEGQVLTIPIRPPTSTPGPAAPATPEPEATQPAAEGTPTTGPGVDGTPPVPNPSHTLPPPDATPPQGPPVGDPTEDASAPGPIISPTILP